MSIIRWVEIDNFHTLRKSIQKYPHLLGAEPVVYYRGKSKQHGTNAAIQVCHGNIVMQSREAIITPMSDNAGFAKWVESKRDLFIEQFMIPMGCSTSTPGVIIYGEWCGQGIMKGAAICEVPEKQFAVFAARILHSIGDATDEIITDPDELKELLGFLIEEKDIRIIPWLANSDVTIDFRLDAEGLQPVLGEINSRVHEVEMCDPWVKETFGVEGVGEGIVYYPLTVDYERFHNLIFKAKGELHRVVQKTKPVQSDPTVMASLQEFTQAVCTQSRMEQGVREVQKGDLNFDMKVMGEFCRWISADIEKECQTEVDASKLDMKFAKKSCVEFARRWFIKNVNER